MYIYQKNKNNNIIYFYLELKVNRVIPIQVNIRNANIILQRVWLGLVAINMCDIITKLS
jgi:hypothetical protein